MVCISIGAKRTETGARTKISIFLRKGRPPFVSLMKTSLCDNANRREDDLITELRLLQARKCS